MSGARAGQAGTGERGRCIAYHRVNCPRFFFAGALVVAPITTAGAVVGGAVVGGAAVVLNAALPGGHSAASATKFGWETWMRNWPTQERTFQERFGFPQEQLERNADALDFWWLKKGDTLLEFVLKVNRGMFKKPEENEEKMVTLLFRILEYWPTTFM